MCTVPQSQQQSAKITHMEMFAKNVRPDINCKKHSTKSSMSVRLYFPQYALSSVAQNAATCFVISASQGQMKESMRERVF